jgi:hypothetical protein
MRSTSAQITYKKTYAKLRKKVEYPKEVFSGTSFYDDMHGAFVPDLVQGGPAVGEDEGAFAGCKPAVDHGMDVFPGLLVLPGLHGVALRRQSEDVAVVLCAEPPDNAGRRPVLELQGKALPDGDLPLQGRVAVDQPLRMCGSGAYNKQEEKASPWKMHGERVYWLTPLFWPDRERPGILIQNYGKFLHPGYYPGILFKQAVSVRQPLIPE